MIWIIFALVTLGIFLWGIGWNWERTLKRPALALSGLPLVSILIPAYKSEDTIGDTLESVKNLDYPKKEVIVVNDHPNDRCSDLARSYGFKVVENTTRLGKCHALNSAARNARGEILFFLDADTVVSGDCLKKMVPWFTQKKVAAVSPRFGVKNKERNLLTRMTALEHYFLNTFFKIHMFFGSLVSFWGFGVAIRRDVFDEMGGWSETLLEDTDFAGKLLKSGYKIQYEPQAMASTIEPVTWGELKTQRIRWGKGSTFAFFNHRKSYRKNPQFLIYFLPYLLMLAAIAGFLAFQSWLFFLPLFSVYIIYTFTLKEFLLLLMVFFVPLYTNLITAAVAGSGAHMAILTASESRNPKEFLLSFPFVCIFVPYIMGCYLKGVCSAVADRKIRKRGELDFRFWEK